MPNSASFVQSSILMLLFISFGAGVMGTALGGIIGLFFKKSTDKAVSYVLNLAAGVMLAIVFFDLIPEAGILIGNKIHFSLLGILIGFFVVFALSKLIDIHTDKAKKHAPDKEKMHSPIELTKTGIIMVIAISLHNFPEGMAIGSLGSLEGGFSRAIMVAILLALHNIPEGMAISVPLIRGGTKTAKTISLVVLAGGITVLGTGLGYLLGSVNPVLTALSLQAAGGAMLYVTFAEIIPQAVYLYNEKATSLFLLFGIVLGMSAIYVGGL